MRAVLLAVTIAATLVATPARTPSTHRTDTNHSSVGFSVPILGGLSRVTGKFSRFRMEFDDDDADPTRSKVTAVIEAASVDTGIDERDAHLRQAGRYRARIPRDDVVRPAGVRRPLQAPRHPRLHRRPGRRRALRPGASAPLTNGPRAGVRGGRAGFCEFVPATANRASRASRIRPSLRHVRAVEAPRTRSPNERNGALATTFSAPRTPIRTRASSLRSERERR